MGKPEGIIENYLGKLCKQYDVLYYKFTSPGVRGVPDRMLIGQGKVLFVELKRPGVSDVRPWQKPIINKMRTHGANVFVINSKNAADIFMRQHFALPQKLNTNSGENSYFKIYNMS